MKKQNFMYLLLGVIGGLLFSVGLCMCLLSEWNAFNQGIVVTAIGGVILLALLGVALKGRTREKEVNWKMVGKVIYGIISSLVLGVGMCLIMEFDLLIVGIIVGVVGIVMLLCLIPMCIGLK